MAVAFKIAKGIKAQLPTEIKEGQVYFTTDEGKLYIDTNNATRVELNAASADKLATAHKINDAAFDGTTDVQISAINEVRVSKTDFRTYFDEHPNSFTTNEVRYFRFDCVGGADDVTKFATYHLPCVDSHMEIHTIDGTGGGEISFRGRLGYQNERRICMQQNERYLERLGKSIYHGRPANNS